MHNVTSLTGNGLRDWLIQRVSAVIIALYSILVFSYIIVNPDLNYQQWSSFMLNPLLIIMTVLSLLSILLHAWIGIWTVLTDYIKCTILRISLQIIVLIFLLACFIAGIFILISAGV